MSTPDRSESDLGYWGRSIAVHSGLIIALLILNQAISRSQLTVKSSQWEVSILEAVLSQQSPAALQASLAPKLEEPYSVLESEPASTDSVSNPEPRPVPAESVSTLESKPASIEPVLAPEIYPLVLKQSPSHLTPRTKPQFTPKKKLAPVKPAPTKSASVKPVISKPVLTKSAPAKLPLSKSALAKSAFVAGRQSSPLIQSLPIKALPPPSAQPIAEPPINSMWLEKNLWELMNSHKRYPFLARRMGVEGKVILEAVIGTKGQIISANIIKSSGSSILDNDALALLRSVTPLRLEQFQLSEHATVRIPVNYALK